MNQLTSYRTCNECNSNKDIKSFSYHSTDGYYSRICLDCLNKKRRLNYKEAAEFIGRPYDKLRCKDDRSKTCPICKDSKSLNLDNFSKKSGKYSKVCRVCHESEFGKNKSPKKGNTPKFTKEENRIRNEKCRPNRLFYQYRKEDFHNQRNFDLTLDFLKQNLINPCSYCGFPSTGLDRIDNSKGHTNENCISCCKECNTARMHHFSHEEMKEIGKTIRKIKLKRIHNN